MRAGIILGLVVLGGLTGCMDANDPDARTHCLISSMCLDIPGNRGDGPGFWGAAAMMAAMPRPAQPVYIQQPPRRPINCTSMLMGNMVSTNCY